MINLYVTFDVDPDGANLTGERSQLLWRCINEIPRLGEEFGRRGIPFTFFLRMDEQIGELEGDTLAIYKRHEPLWRNLQQSGNELGWHPHLNYRNGGEWLPQRDAQAACHSLEESWQAVRTLRFPVRCVRMGEAWHCSETMRTVDRLGLRIDSTAVPGRCRQDTMRAFDWSVTLNRPYHPSCADYRTPGKGDALGILEIPMTTTPMLAPYDDAPVRRYINPTYRPRFFAAGLDGVLAQSSDLEDLHVVLIFHPDELLERRPNDLHAFGWDTFLDNFDTLTSRLAETGASYRYRCLGDAFDESTP